MGAAEPGRAAGGVVGLSDLQTMWSIAQVRRRERASGRSRASSGVLPAGADLFGFTEGAYAGPWVEQ